MVTTAEQFDLAVIGGGPGGYAAALYGSSVGLNVALVEKDKVGGTCLHRGCIPAKEFLETAAVYRHVAGAKEFGIDAGQPIVDFAVSQARKQKVVDGLWKGLAGLIKSRKITTYEGVGSLGAGHAVTVKGTDGSTTSLTATNVILASGSVPRTLPGFDVGGPIMTSDEVLLLDYVPQRVVVIGGGAIGCEFASTFADLGAKVTILEFLPKIIPGCDGDVTNLLSRSLSKRGITIRTDTKVVGHEPMANGTKVLVEGGEPVETDVVVVSVGRRPLADDLGLVGTSVKVDHAGLHRGRRPVPHRRDGCLRHRRRHQHPAARPRRLRRGDHGDQGDPRREPGAGHVRPRALGDLLLPRGGLRGPQRGVGQGGRLRRRRVEAPVPRQQPRRRSSVRPKVS